MSRAKVIPKPLILSVIAVVVTFVHGYAVLLGIDYRGPLLLISHVFDVAAATFLLACCAGIGRLTLKHLGITPEEPIQDLAFSTALGAGLISTSILMFGMIPGALVPGIGILLLVVIIVARAELRELPTVTARAVAQVTRNDSSQLTAMLAVSVLAVAVFFLLILSLAPPSDWDSLMYHLDIPVEFLRGGRIFVPEDNLHVSHIGLSHLLYLPLLAVGSENGPALLNTAAMVLLALSSFSLAKRYFGRQTAYLSLVMIWGTTTFLLVAITPKVDVILALFLFLSHYALLLPLNSEKMRGYPILAAALLGFAFGVKYNALMYAIGLIPLVLLVSRSQTGKLSTALRPTLVFALVAAGTAAPWLIKNWIQLGAPIYPLLSKPLLQPWLVQFFGSAAVPASVDPRIFDLWWEARVPFNLWDAFFNPERITIEAEGSAYFMNPAFLLLPFGVFFIRIKEFSSLVFPAIGYLLLLLIPFPLTNLRYLLPAIAPLTIAAAFIIWRATWWLSSQRIRQALVAVIALAVLLPSARTAYGRLTQTKAAAHAIGLASAQDYLSDYPTLEVRAYSLMTRFVNTQLPRDSRILMLFETRGFYIERQVLQDNIATNWPLLASVLPPGDCLAQAGITHVLVAIGTYRYMIAGGVDPSFYRWDEFVEFADRCLDPIFQGPGFVLFQRRGLSAPPPE